MKRAVLLREPDDNEGTFGRMLLDTGDVFDMIELPDRDNNRNISRIPEGEYRVSAYQSSRFGNVYKVEPVEGRTDIRIHAGNFAGDEAQGFRTDSSGCLLVGSGRGKLNGQKVVTGSRKALMKLKSITGTGPFTLIIV